ncbi:hypothetical protein VB712_13375 [Spirulina sp. CCNP1310]|uniref:hypothetical protein n=1 Tax=Spirulina sp. CCNP1310 TaxID=3110249 RepID=UPI002B200E5F|nr:hypothetical protein [Spirulina sp. CCNP1310]MEA5420215.1 hypothetical protein [Spirulina sp. CCNP1310]
MNTQKERGRSPLLFGAMVAVASFLHGGILLIPLPASPPPPEPELEQVENVPITRLPTPTPQRPPIPSSTPTPTPRSHRPPTRPQPNPQPARTVAPPPNPQPPPPQANASVPSPQPSPPQTPNPETQPSPTPQPGPAPSPSPEPEPTDLIPDFPHMAGAVAGCQNREDCYAVPGETLRSVTGNLRASLAAQGYSLRERADLGDDQGIRVYEVTHPDRPEPLFLTVVAFNSPETGGDVARYILAPEPVENLRDL